MSKRVPPKWSVESPNKPNLKLYNSLTRQKEEFVPKDGKTVQWYSCGPTVYDASHMGHARSYITFDILRRVLSEYFGYQVLYVMNITDIDDKIIKNARKSHLYNSYLEEKRTTEQELKNTREALLLLLIMVEEAKMPEVKDMLSKRADKVRSAIPKLEKAVLDNCESDLKAAMEEFRETTKDVISDWLDKQKGHTVKDNSIFLQFPRFWEEEFHKDMDLLNIQRPDVLTRVTEYIPEIVSYVEQIIKNGLAYESNGSVYFDVTKFNNLPKHFYAKLVPEAFGDVTQLEDGEGELSSKTDKKSPNDFALWKASKPGEPWWDSPWGQGRPGWHIECSVMASAICGDSLDVHTGGVDLKFPHHDNEIAQAEAYFDKNCWVRYFLHSGHLKIEGQKMSKSLKNFITIKQALNSYTARQLRLAFLLHSWKDPLDYSENTMEMSLSYEKSLNEFFLAVKDIMLRNNAKEFSSNMKKWTDQDLKMNKLYLDTKEAVDVALCDNIDTRTALLKIKECISNCNIYLQKNANVQLLENIAIYITSIMKMFGAINENTVIGFPLQNTSDNVETILMPYLRVLGDFRDSVRKEAKNLKANEILRLCDDLRDNILPDLSVRLEDREGGSCAVKLVDKEVLRREKEAKNKIESDKNQAKLKAQEELKASRALREAQKQLEPSKMFLHMTDKFSAFDENGFPTLDVEGKEISKGQLKKLQKLYQAQQKKFESAS